MKTDKQRWKIVPLATVAYVARTAGRVTFDPTTGTPGRMQRDDVCAQQTQTDKRTKKPNP